ncbi:MAG: hypothetical protein QM765_07450 [Myxococcales bacterium]
MTLRNLLRAATCIALLGLTACSSPCQNACSHKAWCDEHLAFPSVTNASTCTEQCEANNDNCTNWGEVQNCIAGVQCENAINYGLSELSCLSLCKTK